MKNRRFLVWDAFTETPFEGNPCGIIPDADGLTDETMQKIACELNLPETSFVMSSKKADFRVRYFTPRYELGFAGHPTIATSFMLAKEGLVDLSKSINTIKLEFNIGVLPVDIYAENGIPTQAVMTQSAPTYGEVVSVDEAEQCFTNLSKEDFLTGCEPQVTGTGTNFLMVPLKSVEKLADLAMQREKLCEIVDKVGVSAAYVFAMKQTPAGSVLCGRLADPRNAFEDPFTGSAVGAAGAYLVHNGLTDQHEIQVEQGHFIGRPGYGTLLLKHADKNVELVQLGGRAVKVSDGLMYMRKN